MTDTINYGERLGALKATPAKRALRNDARKLGVADAIAEVVDNVIDNAAKQERLGRDASGLEMDVWLEPEQVRVEENSGGVTPDDLRAFVRMGAHGESVDSPKIGVWGAGQKLALAALGQDVTITTRYWDSSHRYEVESRTTDQVLLRMDEAWWNNEEDWDVPVFLPDGELPSGETTYLIGRLNRRIDAEVVAEVRAELEDLYGDMLHAGSTVIRLNGEPLKAAPWLSPEALARVFAFPPGFEPARHLHQLVVRSQKMEAGKQIDDVRKLEMEILIGLTPRQDVRQAGVYMFGQPRTESGAQLGPRKFVKDPLQDESVGYTSGPRSYLRKGHPTLGRLRIYVVFRGDSEDIPWGMPGSSVKRGFNTSSIFASQIRDRIIDAARPYARYTSKAREIDLVPHSAIWNEMSEGDRKLLVRRGAYLEPDDIDERDVRDRVRPLMQHEFVPTTPVTWDHRLEADGPPEPSPSFDDAMSKEAVGLLTERDRRLKELHGGDPTALVDTLMGYLQKIEEKEEDGWAPEEEEADPAEVRLVTVSVRLPRRMLRNLVARSRASSNADAVMKAVQSFIDQEE
jgi:hypothetical protein